jgi:predicted methyltransferase
LNRALILLLAAGAASALVSLPAVAQNSAAGAVAAAVADPARPDADRARDPLRKPDQSLNFSTVKRGDKVADLLPGGGYFTRLLCKVVGPTGKVYAVIPDLPPVRPQDIAAMAAVEKDCGNVVEVRGPILAFKPPEKLDVIWTSENYHDLRIPMFGSQSMTAFNKMVFDDLKPGGIFYIEDHAAAAGAGATVAGTLHRIEATTVVDEVTAAGFRLEDKSDFLANPADDHTLAIFNPAIRGKTDKFVLRFRKPR